MYKDYQKGGSHFWQPLSITPQLFKPTRSRRVVFRSQTHAGTIAPAQSNPATVKICSAALILVRSPDRWVLAPTALHGDRAAQVSRVCHLGGVA